MALRQKSLRFFILFLLFDSELIAGNCHIVVSFHKSIIDDPEKQNRALQKRSGT